MFGIRLSLNRLVHQRREEISLPELSFLKIIPQQHRLALLGNKKLLREKRVIGLQTMTIL